MSEGLVLRHQGGIGLRMGLKILFPSSAGAGFSKSYAQDRSLADQAGPVEQHDVEDSEFHPQGWCTGGSFLYTDRQ
jgi:hypothetical protein